MADVVLVDEEDRVLGVCEKQQAHIEGRLHRALSVFVLDGTGTRMLLQQRASSKYHSGGLWSNACCSHPAPNEPVEAAAHRRLSEELGFDCPLEFAFAFIYRANVGDDLVEHELDHVFVGRSDVIGAHDPGEIDAIAWVDVDDVVRDLDAHPERYSAWFGIALGQLRTRGFVS
jgi:isopentenyl-diphosphate delta-isomerase